MNAPPSALNLFENPILRRFRRSQMRPVRLGVTIVLTLVIASFLAIPTYLSLHNRAGWTEADAARAIFLPLLAFQMIILAIFGTTAIGAGILRESEEGMIEYQRLSPLSPLAKVLGYLFGLPIRQYVAFGITAIFSAFSIVVGRIPFEAWGSVYLALFSSIILYHTLTLITGLITKSRWRGGVISLGLVLLMNLVLPRLAGFGFTIFSHLSIIPVVWVHLADLIPVVRGTSPGWARQLIAPDVPFWGWHLSHLTFALVVQGSLILTFMVMLVRRWRDEQAHLLGKGYAVGWLLWLQALLLGNVLPLIDQGRVLGGVLARQTDLPRALRRLSGAMEAQVLAVAYGVISLLILLPIIACTTPRESTQMVAFRRQKKFGQRWIPWLADGATAAPLVWIAAGVTGAAWAIFVERMVSSSAFDGRGFPVPGWAVFIGIVFVTAAIFHFLLESYGPRVAWLTLFLAGFLPLFTSLVLMSIREGWAETARYLVALSPLSTPWQPLQWLDQTELLTRPARGRSPDFGPFVLFCVVHLSLCIALFIAWRRRRGARQARA